MYMSNNHVKSFLGLYIRNDELSSDKHKLQFLTLASFFQEKGVQLIECSSIQDLDSIVKTNNPDFILYFDKDIYRAKKYEKSGIPVFNNSHSLRICDEKILTYLEVEGLRNIKLIDSIVGPVIFYDNKKFLKKLFSDAFFSFGFPFVLKSNKGSLGEQVFLIQNEESFYEATAKLGKDQLICQRFISTSFGRDLRVWVVNNQVVKTAVRKSSSRNEFRSSVSLGGAYDNSYELSARDEKLVAAISKKLKMSFGTIDFLFGPENTLFFCEANTNAVFSNLDASIGESIASFIMREVYA